jgi:hypothetical protein
MADTAILPDTRYEFAIKGDGLHFFLTDTELLLSDEGILYSYKGRSGLRPFSGLKGIRLQVLAAKPWMGVVELTFMRGASLFVYSKVQAGGGQERNQAFAAFIGDLHQRLSVDDKKRIVFRRGITPVRHWLVIACTFPFVAVLVVAIGMVLFGPVPLREALFPILAFAGFTAGFCGLIKTTWPGVYDPDDLPRDLLGPCA